MCFLKGTIDIPVKKTERSKLPVIIVILCWYSILPFQSKERNIRKWQQITFSSRISVCIHQEYRQHTGKGVLSFKMVQKKFTRNKICFHPLHDCYHLVLINLSLHLLIYSHFFSSTESITPSFSLFLVISSWIPMYKHSHSCTQFKHLFLSHSLWNDIITVT